MAIKKKKTKKKTIKNVPNKISQNLDIDFSRFQYFN